MHPSLWPIPKEVTWREEALPLQHADIVVPVQARGDDLSAAQLLADLIPIASVTLHGAPPSPEAREQGQVSQARPMLLGITAVELPKLEDC